MCNLQQNHKTKNITKGYPTKSILDLTSVKP